MRIASLVLCLIYLTSCGGGGSGSSSDSSNSNQTYSYWDCGGAGGLGLFFTWLSGGCTQITGSIQPPPDTGTLTEDQIAVWGFGQYDEREPNNTLEQSLSFFLYRGSSVSIFGTVNGVTDNSDYVVFGSDSNNLVSAYLCPTVDSCFLPFYSGNDMHLELLDENGNVLVSTYMMQTGNGHEVVFTPSDGLHYYLAVKASETTSISYDYRLVITD